MKFVAVATIVTVATAIVYFGWVLLSAWLETKNSPKEPMFLCNAHGFIRQKHLISFMGVPYCPVCFHTRLSSMEKVDK